MATTIHVGLPRRELGDEVAAALGSQGLDVEIVDEGETCALEVRYATDEHERLVSDGTAALEAWLGTQTIPLVVEPADGGFVLRPPAG